MSILNSPLEIYIKKPFIKILIEIIIILVSLALSIVAGYFLYALIETIRLDLYCKEFREGLNCYQEGWVTNPAWLVSLVGGFIAALSITLVSVFLPTTRVRSSIITLGLGSIVACPFTLAIAGPIAFLVTVSSGSIALLVVLRLTRRSRMDSLRPKI